MIRIKEKTANLQKLSGVEPEKMEWLWPNRIPLGKLTLLVGNPGVGKSFLSLYIAAQISRGRPWIDTFGSTSAGSTILLTAEDDIGDTVRVRAEAAGADLDKLLVLQSMKVTIQDPVTGADVDGECGMYNLTRDLDVLRSAILQVKDTRLVVIDPISAYMAGKNSNNNTEVREFLTPITDLAAEMNISIIGISHLNKNQETSAAYRTLGSIGFTAAARAVWLIAEDQDDRERILMIPSKGNLSNKPTGLAYKLMSQSVQTKDGLTDSAMCVFEAEPIDITADEVLIVDVQKKRKATKKDSAADWLKKLLTGRNMEAAEIYKLAKVEGFSDMTLKRAKAKLGVQSDREFGEMGTFKWIWSLLS